MRSLCVRLFVSLLLLASTLLIVPSMPVHAGTLTVTNTNDSGPGSLREAIGAAVNGDTIVFSGVSGTITLLSELVISHDITITGPGMGVLSVSGGDTVRVFRIDEGVNVFISGLTITHGKVMDQIGGGILNGLGSTLTLDQVTVSHSHVLDTYGGALGGGIYNSGTLIFTNGAISYNTARAGGGLYNYFGASLLMTNVSVDHNQVISDGGGLEIRGPSSDQIPPPVILDKVSITDNSITGDGEAGGIYSDDSITITNSLIANNSADHTAGLELVDQTLPSLPAVITLTNTTITGNTSVSSAGLYIHLFLAASSATLNNLTIANNHNSTESISGAGIGATGLGTVHVKNTLIAGNTSHDSTPSDCVGTIDSQDYNLIQSTSGCTITGATDHNITGVSPQLDVLAQNGGPTQSMALLGSSPAVDAGNDDTCASTDQRGVARPQGLHCDMGAYELLQYTLSVGRIGTGTGTVTSSPPGIDCGSTCSNSFNYGSVVTLAATADPGSTFIGWDDPSCPGTDSCSFTVEADKLITANFQRENYPVFLPLVVR